MEKTEKLKLMIAENVRKYRNMKGLSHEELAELTGLPYEALIKIETGKLEKVTIQDIESVATALDVSLNDIIEINE